MAQAKTGLYVLQGVDPAQVAAAPFDVKVVDIYDNNGAAFTPAQVHQMGGGPGSALLLGYFSLGEAETYRAYFDTIPKAALGPENPQWKGNYEVAYWTPEWRQVATAYIDRIIAAGYDGAYFDVVDEFQTAWAKGHAPGGAAGAESAMVDLVKSLHDYATAKVPGFKIWANNAEELLDNPTYLSSIDGMFKENLFYTDQGGKQPASETKASLELLQKAIAAGKDVVAIEYVTGADKVADVHAQAEKAGVGSYVAHLDLDGVDLEGVVPGQVIHPDDTAGTPVTPVEPQPTQPTTPTDPSAPTPPKAEGGTTIHGGDDGGRIVGGAGSDHLYGGAGRDVVKGGAGNDWIEGGRGRDNLTGGTGDDTFAFRESGSRNADTITDFAHGKDKIALDHAAFAALGPVGALAASQLALGPSATGRGTHLIYDPATGTLSYDADGSGRAAPTVIAHLDREPTLDYHDFLVV